MSSAPTSLVDLLNDCDALGVRLLPKSNGSLTIDAPLGTLRPDLLNRLKVHKAELLALLLRAGEFDVDGAPDAEPAPVVDPVTVSKPICRCGSTTWRELPIHDGQSVRRDCGNCSRFIEFAIWYGNDTGHNDQHSIA